MTRFFAGNLGSGPRVIRLTGANARHAAVLRLGVDDEVVVCNGAGIDYLCRVESIGKDVYELDVIECRPNPLEPEVNVYLFPALIKGDRLEYVVQKAVELGVYAIYPFESHNSVVTASRRVERLEKIAESAAKQCGRGVIPHINPPLTFDEAVYKAERLAPDLTMVAHEKSAAPLKTFVAKQKSVAVFIGPEGGFTDGECLIFQRNAAALFSLGKRILRADTAAVVAVACLFYELG